MKKYIAPKSVSIEIKNEGIICSSLNSGGNGNGIPNESSESRSLFWDD